MQLQQYINSGILEEYCLGLLTESDQQAVLAMSTVYPEVKKDLDEIHTALERFGLLDALVPDEYLKQRVMAALHPITLTDLPKTNKFSDREAWLTAVQHLIPQKPFSDFFAHRLRADDTIEQTLIVTRVGIPREVHRDVIESYFILEGQCVCNIGHDTHKVEAGDLLEIPLYEAHDLTLISDHVIAIVQRQTI